MTRCVLAALVAVLVSAQSGVADESEDGWRFRPDVGFRHGDHNVDLWLHFRYRWEEWNARTPSSDSFSGFQTRFGASYGYRELVDVLVEAQHTAIVSLGNESSGPGNLYWENSGYQTNPHSIHVKRLYVQWRPIEEARLKLGRQNMNMGTWSAYSESDWKYVKHGRMSQRLVGIVGWTQVTRSYDGGLAAVDLGDHRLVGFAAQPTQGVVDVENAFKFLSDVVVGGIEWTAPPGALLEQVDFTAFFTGYNDGRRVTKFRPDGRVVSDVTVFTIGGSALSIFPLGPGRMDAFVWGAFQWGDYPDLTGSAGRPRLDHSAGSLLAEFGYRLPEVHGQPWLRTGVNFATGDGDPTDGNHGTFFNQLPTNHPYYGYVDQLALQNLVNWFAQIRWSPLPKLALEIFGHRFWLADESDGRYFGTGAFNEVGFGYGSSPSNGSKDVGWELDVVLSYQLARRLSVAGGYGQLFGGTVFRGTPNSRNVQWGFLQLAFEY